MLWEQASRLDPRKGMMGRGEQVRQLERVLGMGRVWGVSLRHREGRELPSIQQRGIRKMLLSGHLYILKCVPLTKAMEGRKDRLVSEFQVTVSHCGEIKAGTLHAHSGADRVHTLISVSSSQLAVIHLQCRMPSLGNGANSGLGLPTPIKTVSQVHVYRTACCKNVPH